MTGSSTLVPECSMPRTLQRVYSHEDYCLFAVIPTGVVLSVADGFLFCLVFEKWCWRGVGLESVANH